MDGGSSPAREGSAGGAGLELSLRVLSLKFCCKHLCSSWCNVCSVCALLWHCSCLAAGVLPQEGKGPFLLLWIICLCWFVLARGTCQMLLAEKRWLSVCTGENCCFREGLSSLVEWFAFSEQISNFCILGHRGHSWKRQWHILNPLGKELGQGESNGQPFTPHNPNRCVQQSGKSLKQ